VVATVAVANGTISANMIAVVAASSSQTGRSCVASDNAGAVVVGRVVEVTVLVVLGADMTALAIADVTKTSSSTSANVLGHTLELIVALFTAAEDTTLGLELIHSHGGQSSCSVVGRSVVVDLMNGDSSVNNIGLDNLLLYDWLDGLVDVVVHMFTSDGWCDALALGGSLYNALILELSLLLDKVPLGRVVIAVVKLAVLYGTKLSSVGLGKDLTVVNRLYCAVVVILVNLLVNSSVDLFVLVRLDGLVCYSWGNGLMDSGIMVTRLLGEVGEGCFDLIHFDRFG